MFLLQNFQMQTNLKIENLNKEHIRSLLNVLDEIGVEYTESENSLVINKGKNLKPIKGSIRKIRNIQITIKQFIQKNLP